MKFSAGHLLTYATAKLIQLHWFIGLTGLAVTRHQFSLVAEYCCLLCEPMIFGRIYDGLVYICCGLQVSVECLQC